MTKYLDQIVSKEKTFREPSIMFFVLKKNIILFAAG